MTEPTQRASALDRRLAYALLRAVVGLNLAMHGIARMLSGAHAFAESMVKMFHAAPLPAWSVLSFGLALVWIEAGTGLLLLLGLATRWTLLAGLLTMLALTFGTTLLQQWEIAGTQLIYAAIYAALLAFRRQNAYSIDGLLGRAAGSRG
jgi:thiosulfate dehydrogenase (quinone) large subunit